MEGRSCCEKPFRKAIVGGAFDRLHKGHRALLDTAVKLADSLMVGLADGPLLAGKAFRERILPFDERRALLSSYLTGKNISFQIVKIVEPIGPAGTDEEADLIVVSPETYERALMINEERRRNGLRELFIVVVPTVLAEDGAPLKSHRIRAGEIDLEGRLIKG
ncbi:MAG: pantetheine-phosphate adenylyltransferase [Candidatus Korarchaeota archaeon]|nr:pantetheine-phosphate adenylyltransferase [Candidatus Korarchaeota archaeon]